MDANARLYAMGIDAYNIVPYLGRLGNSPTTGYPGESGRIYIDAERRLHRQLMWARYNGNTALPINDAPLSWTPTP
jgi:outer membrane PBP1 activator LpoA protein